MLLVSLILLISSSSSSSSLVATNWEQVARDEYGYNIVRHPYLLHKQLHQQRLIHPRELLLPYEYLLREANDQLITPDHHHQTHTANKTISNAEERLYDLETFVELVSAPTSRDHWQYASDSEALNAAKPVGNSSKCEEDFQFILNLIGLNKPNGSLGEHLFSDGTQNIKLLEFVESFGRPTQETYLGQSNWLGSYRECQRAHIPTNGNYNDNADATIIKTRYCVGKMVAKSWPTRPIKIAPPTTMKVGLCLPEACDSIVAYKQHKSSLEKILKLNFPYYLRDRFDLTSVYCLPDERSPMRQWTLATVLFVTFCLVWLFTVVLFSLKNYLDNNQTTTYEHLLAIGPNMRHFLDVKPTNGVKKFIEEEEEYSMYSRVNLNAVDFIKVILSALVIFGHSYTSIGWMVTTSTFNIEQGVFWPNSLSFALLRTVDVFFVLGGMLASYVILKKFSSSNGMSYHQLIKPKVWFMINLQRFLRLSPMYMLVYAYEKTLEVYTGQGPWWDYGTSKHTSYRGNCIRSSTWYKMIILFGNFGQNPIPDCNGISWYLVADSQIFLLVPLLIYLIVRLGLKRSALLILAPITSLVAYKLTLNLAKQQVFDLNKLYVYGLMYSFNLIVKFSSTAHTGSLYRISSVTFGLYAGYCLHLYERQAIKQWPGWMRGTCFKLILLMASGAYIVQYPLFTYVHMVNQVPVDQQNMLVANFLGTFVTPIVTCVILLRVCTDLSMAVAPSATKNGSTSSSSSSSSLLKQLLRHKLWRVVGKLTYCFYLIHLNIIIYLLTSWQEARPGATLVIEACKVFALTFAITCVMSFLLYILYELPMARLLTKITNSLLMQPNKGTTTRAPTDKRPLHTSKTHKQQ